MPAANSGPDDASQRDSGQSDAAIPPADLTLGKGSSTTLSVKGGTLTITNSAGDPTVKIDVPSGALAGDTLAVLTPVNLAVSAPSSVMQVTPGFQLELAGKLSTAAKARLSLPYSPPDGDLVILGYATSGAAFVKYAIEKDMGAVYASFDVAGAARYFALRLIPQASCDKTTTLSSSITSQADVDALANVRHISGDLAITGSAVTSLANLKCLQQLDGSLVISDTAATSLDGLDQLTFGTATISILNNPQLDSANLPALLAIGGTGIYTVSSNSVLTRVSADVLNAASIQFSGNGSSASDIVLSFKALELSRQVSIGDNPSLKDFDGFDALKNVAGSITISNSGASELEGFKALESCGDLNIANNKALTSVAGLGNLSHLTALNVAENPLLTDVKLPALISANDIVVDQNATLAQVNLDVLPALSGSARFTTNGTAASAATTVLSMAELTSVGQNFAVTNNPKLKTLAGFPMLSRVGAAFAITSNALLPTCGAVALRNQVMNHGAVGSAMISGNLSDGCTP